MSKPLSELKSKIKKEILEKAKIKSEKIIKESCINTQ